jgi:hypothetical protein
LSKQIDNEIEIASSTHQDMHPTYAYFIARFKSRLADTYLLRPMGYDEELARVINYSIIAKEALPSVKVAAPSTCAWWFYWTSTIGYTDNGEDSVISPDMIIQALTCRA